jgi:hypothetical protein
MNRNCRTFVAAGAVFVTLWAVDRPTLAWAACETSEKVDKTTVEETRKRLEQAGYKNIRNWRKGCDNAWHATAIKNGTAVNVAVLPDGHVVKEGD